MSGEPTETDGLLRSSRDFRNFWIGQTISRLGSHVGETAISFTALLTLQATPAQMGLLTAAGSVPVLLLGLSAGLWVDRLRRKPIMIAADFARGALLATVPIAALTGILTISQLCLIAALMGVLSLFFDLANAAYLPSLVPARQLVEANSRISASSSVAEIGGQSLGGLLVQALTAPMAVALDALSYLASAAYLLRIKAGEAASTFARHEEGPLREIREGMHVVLRHPTLRALTLCDGGGAFFGSFYAVLYSLFAIRALQLSPFLVGISIAVGGLGSLTGALLSNRIVLRRGRARTLVYGRLIAAAVQPVFLLDGLAVPIAAAGLMAMQFVGDVAWTLYEISARSIRQETIPTHLLGRAHAGMEVLTRGVSPVGAILAGVLASFWSPGAALAVGYIGLLLSALTVVSLNRSSAAEITSERVPPDRRA